MSVVDHLVSTTAHAELGVPDVRTDIRSTMGPFAVLPSYTVAYPPVVVEALCRLYAEYNAAFAPLVEANREWDTDYQYCQPLNSAVQIDMMGLQEGLLKELAEMSVDEVCETLRHKIFEIDNSVAMYQLLNRVFAFGDQPSFFSVRWAEVLGSLRRQHGKPIALLAVTPEKYQAMLETEFGVTSGDELSDDVVKDLTGFDAFFGPDEFTAHVAANGGECQYLLYVRSSEPVAKLRKPGVVVHQPLLGDPSMRRLIKANALTLNVDDPDGSDPAARINDTKGYMTTMGMGAAIEELEDLFGSDFEEYLLARGIHAADVHAGEVHLRAKPAAGAYGCYGHVRGPITHKLVRRDIRVGLRSRGTYIVQPEIPASVIVNTANGTEYAFIDRVFFGVDNGQIICLGGFRNFMPLASTEAQEGRIHGNGEAVWGQILPAS